MEIKDKFVLEPNDILVIIELIESILLHTKLTILRYFLLTKKYISYIMLSIAALAFIWCIYLMNN